MICEYCEARSDEEPESALRKMMSCNNCRADIQIKGKWTGVGYNILNDLIAKHGIDKMREICSKLKKEKEATDVSE